MPLSRPLVLVVEDDRVTREMSSEAIRAAGLRILACESGDAALELVAAQHPDLVVLDLTMPGLSGLEVLRAIRARKESADLPVIVATGHSDLPTIAAAYRAGATDFVIKPIVHPILIERIRYMLRSSDAFRTLATARRALEDAQRLMRSGSWEWNARQGTLFASQSLREMLSIGVESAEAASLVELTRWIHPEDRASAANRFRTCLESGEPFLMDHRVLAAGGEILFVRQQVAGLIGDDGSVCGLQGVVLDRTREERASRLADLWEHYDADTGLPNRRRLLEALDRAIDAAIPGGDRVAVVCLALDRASTLLATLDDAGQRDLARAMAERLSAAARDATLLAGPDRTARAFVARSRETQFCVLLTHLGEARETAELVHRLRERLAAPFSAEEHPDLVGSSPSAGLAFFPSDGNRPGDLLRAAERALHEARARGGDRLEIASAELTDRIDSALNLERELAHAFRDDRLEVAYQPIVDLKTGRAVAFEASIGWSGAGVGGFTLVPPASLAEHVGRIEPLGRWFVEAACAGVASFGSVGPDGPRLCLDAAPSALVRRDAIARLEASLRRRDVRPERIQLELDARALGEPGGELQYALRALRSLGVRIALDHFGDAPGALGCLLELPFDTLKLAPGLAAAAAHPKPAARRLIAGFVALAQDLGVRVVADGVTSLEALDALRACDVDAVQGSLVSAPVPAGRAAALLDRDLLGRFAAQRPFATQHRE